MTGRRPANLINRQSRGEGRGAFSLTELVAVVAITGILAAMAIPRFASAAAHQRAEAATRRIAADLKLAQRLAKASSVPHRVCFSTSQNTYNIERAAADKSWSTISVSDHAADAHRVSLDAAPYEAELSSATLSGILEFDAYGRPSGDFRLILHVGTRWMMLNLDAETGEITTTELDRISAQETVETDVAAAS